MGQTFTVLYPFFMGRTFTILYPFFTGRTFTVLYPFFTGRTFMVLYPFFTGLTFTVLYPFFKGRTFTVLYPFFTGRTFTVLYPFFTGRTFTVLYQFFMGRTFTVLYPFFTGRTFTVLYPFFTGDFYGSLPILHGTDLYGSLPILHGTDLYGSLPILYGTDLYSVFIFWGCWGNLVTRHHFACFDFKTRLPCARMFTCINNGVSRCCEEKSDPKSKKTIFFSNFWSKKFADSLWHESLVLYMPKRDKNDASNSLIIGHEVLQKCSNFFQSDIGLGLDPKWSWKKVWFPHVTRRFPGEPGASELQPKRGTTC